MNKELPLPEAISKVNKDSLLEFFIENSSDIIWMLDADLIIKYVSHTLTNITGNSTTNHLSKPFSSLVTAVSLENIKHIFANQQYLETFENIKITYLSKKRPIASAILNGKLIKDSSGKFLGAICISTNSEIKVSGDTAKSENNKFNIEANQFKSIILGNVGHELRTPLNAIIGFANILSSELVQPANREMLGYIKESAGKLNTTINSIITLSALESEQLYINLQLIDLYEVINNVYHSFEDIISSKNIIFELEYIKADHNIYSDEYIITIIIYYLIDNAVKFTSKGRIGISVSNEIDNDSDFTVIRVNDTGIGIEAHKFNSIFEPFRQASEGITRNFEGIGLGLTVAKKLTGILGGKIEIHSIINQGSTFTVFIPNTPAKSRN